MAKIMKTEFKSQEESFSNTSPQPILQLEPLSNDESLVLNDIFDNCLEPDETKPITFKLNNLNENATVRNSEVKQDSPNVSVKNEIKTEPTTVEDTESSFKSEPKPEEVRVKEDSALHGDSVKCISVDYSKTEVCKFMESDSDGEDNETDLHIDTSSDPLAPPPVNAYHFIRLSNCVTCGQIFNKKILFYDHIFNTHEIFFLRCRYCKQKVTIKQLKTHLRDHIHKEALSNMPIERSIQIIGLKCEITCEICGVVFTSVQSLCPNRIQKHLMKHIKVPYKCDRCDRIFNGRGPLMKHILCHQRNSCLDCDRVFKTRKQLDQHLSFHQATPIACEICNQKFFMKAAYNKHIQDHATIECDKCNKKFLTTAKLNAHKANHPLKCNKCNVSFKLLIQLVRHQRKKHKTNEGEGSHAENEYECMKCMKTFKTMVEYSLHTHI